MQPFVPSVLCTTLVPDMDASSASPAIPGYTILRKLGQGGMASVWLARQDTLDRAVSIKVLEGASASEESCMRRFENEARTIARLSHPGIVGIFEIGRTADGRPFYSMPFLPNGDLHHHVELAGKELRIVEILRHLLHSLDYAHARGIVHRDVKPENVLFDANDRPMLADFGIALSRRASDRRITSAGMAVGSSAYMAPEQAKGQVVDGRADLYSVGVLAFELLTGQLPYQSDDPFALALMHAQWDIPRLPSSKWHWQAFIDRAMAKSPDERFQNAPEMLRALRRIGDRSGPHLQQRALRTLDRTAPGEGWRRPRLLALFGLFLVVSGVYTQRHHLPRFDFPSANAAVVSANPQAARVEQVVPREAAPSAALPLPAPVAAASLPARAGSASVGGDDLSAAAPHKRTRHVASSRTASRHHRAAAPAQPVAAATPAQPKRGLLGRIWQHIRHPIASARNAGHGN